MSSLRDLDDARRYVSQVSTRLDPDSRYIAELLEVIDQSRDLAHLEQLLLAAGRGLRHSGEEVFSAMSLEEKLLANLITPETSLFRFNEGELEAIGEHLIPTISSRQARVLIVPCSHGEEAFTIAAHLLKLGVDFEIDAFDVQPALIEEAKLGRLTFGYPLEYLESPGRVSPGVLERIRFQVGDAFDLPLPSPEPSNQYDLILCRNFVGYFTPDSAAELVSGFAARIRSGGVLLLDGFALSKMPNLLLELDRLGGRRLRGRPAFHFIQALMRTT